MAEDTATLEAQVRNSERFYSWFDRALKNTILDNRRRYRMILDDEAERASRNLSCLASTKSTLFVDKFVESAMQIYFGDPDSISYTARAFGDESKDQMAKLLTEIFKYRSRTSFKTKKWLKKGLKAAATDGIICAFVSWKKSFYEKDEEVEGFFGPVTQTREVVVQDTFWLDLLDPLSQVCWDPNAPLLDANLGQFATVKVQRSCEDIETLIKSGLFDAITEEELEQYQGKKDDRESQDWTNPSRNALSEGFGEYDPLELWMSFFKEDNQWMVLFSLNGDKEISTAKSVNDVFFAGREVNRLPLVIGYLDDELWENVGRGIPKIIAPLEDEYIDHKNNLNDWAKRQLLGKWWIDDDANVDIDQLLNYPVVKGKFGQEFGQITDPARTMEVFRQADSIEGEMNALNSTSPTSMSRSVVPKGTDATLGAMQLGENASETKMGVQLMTLNETFLEDLLWLIAQNIFSFESDETIVRIAAGYAGVAPPEAMTMGGQRLIDFSQLDFDVDVQINAGLGSQPSRNKFMSIMQINQLAQSLNLDTDGLAIGHQAEVLAGFKSGQFIIGPKAPPPPPATEYKATVNIDLVTLLQMSPMAGQFLLEKFMNGEMNTTASVKDNTGMQKSINEMRQNQMPDRTGQMVDSTGEEGQAMSQGGMNG